MYQLTFSYDQLVMLSLLLQPTSIAPEWKRDATIVRAFVLAELARANLRARECLDCG